MVSARVPVPVPLVDIGTMVKTGAHTVGFALNLKISSSMHHHGPDKHTMWTTMPALILPRREIV